MSILTEDPRAHSSSSDLPTKRERLSEIVSRLGEDASPAQIRQEAYRVGFGVVSTDMLRVVRDAVWPKRPRRPGGYTREQMDAAKAPLLKALVPCPGCGSARVWAQSCYRYKDRGKAGHGVGENAGKVMRWRLCKDCGLRFKRVELDTGRRPAKQSQLIRAATLTEKACTRCKLVQPIESFRLRGSTGVVRRSECKECEADRNFRGVLKRSLKQYGLTEEQYRQMLVSQGGRCAICRTDNPFGPRDMISKQRKRRVFSLDHCHATGRVRGLLRARCNISIGLFSDDSDVLRSAAEYVDHHRRLAESAVI